MSGHTPNPDLVAAGASIVALTDHAAATNGIINFERTLVANSKLAFCLPGEQRDEPAPAGVFGCPASIQVGVAAAPVNSPPVSERLTAWIAERPVAPSKVPRSPGLAI